MIIIYNINMVWKSVLVVFTDPPPPPTPSEGEGGEGGVTRHHLIQGTPFWVSSKVVTNDVLSRSMSVLCLSVLCLSVLCCALSVLCSAEDVCHPDVGAGVKDAAVEPEEEDERKDEDVEEVPGVLVEIKMLDVDVASCFR